MDYYRSSIKLIISIVLLFHCQQGIAQYDKSMLDSNYKFSISLGVTSQTYYDGTPIVWEGDNYSLPYLGALASINVKINKLYSFEFTTSIIGNYYNGRCFQCQEVGEVSHRSLYFFAPKIKRNFFNDVKLNIDGVGGVQHRLGNESIVASYGKFDTHIESQFCIDLGLLIGVEVYRNILKSRIRLSACLTHTEYLYRYDRAGELPYSWDNGSTRRMTQVLFSIGYNFGQIPFKE